MTDPAHVSLTKKRGRTQSWTKWVRSFAVRTIRTKLIAVFIAAAAIYVSIICAPGIPGILGAALALLIVIIAVIDLQSFVIPDSLNAVGIVLAFVQAGTEDPHGMWSAVAISAIRGLTLALIFLALRSAYAYVRGRQGLGLGDIKLAAVAGAWLDWFTIPIAIELGALAALSGYVLRQFVLGRPISATNRLPFGFFFAPAIWICWLLEKTWMGPV